MIFCGSEISPRRSIAASPRDVGRFEGGRSVAESVLSALGDEWV